MATLTGTSLTLTDTLFDDADLGLNGVHFITSAVVNGTTYIYTSSYYDHAIQILTLAADGTLSPVASLAATPPSGTSVGGPFSDPDAEVVETTPENVELQNPFVIATFDVGGSPFLAVSSYIDGRITTYALSDSAPYLTLADTVEQSENPDFNLEHTYDIEVLNLSGGTYIYAAGLGSDGVSVFSVNSSGVMSNVQNVDDSGVTIELDNSCGIAEFTLGGTQYLTVTELNGRALSVFSVDQTTGELSIAATFRGHLDGVLNGATFLDATIIDGIAYLYVPEIYGDAITVLSFDGSTVSLVQHITSETDLSHADAAKLIDLGGRTVLAVVAQDSSQVNLYELDTDPQSAGTGTLTLLDSDTAGGAGGHLYKAVYSHSLTIGGATYLMVTAKFGDAISVYAIEDGDDSLTGTAYDDDISGGDGSDTLSGAAGDDLVRGDAGTDQINGDTGQDTIDGGNGDDTLRGGDDDDRIFGDTGDDIIAGNDGDDYLRGDSGDDAIFGGNDNDDIDGGTGHDTIDGGNGDDLMRGDTGDDQINGGSGSDTVAGNGGDDTLRGEAGDDLIFGGLGHDLVAGNEGDDTLHGDTGNDEIFGGDGSDDIDGGDGADSANGGLGDDLIRGGTGDDLLTGSRGADTLAGNAGNDEIFGGADDDLLIGGTGSDTMSGESGADTFVFSNVNQSIHGATRDVITDFEAGVDLIDLSGFTGTLSFVSAYTGAGNEVRYNGAIGRLYVDIDGGASDFSVDLTGAPGIDAGDLIL